MTEREALRLALEALQGGYGNTRNWHEAIEAAITAIKQALEQPEPEPVALAKSLALNLDGVIADVEQGDGFDDVCLETIKFVRDSLNTTPPKREPQEPVECMCGICKLGKREWQGLTDEERMELAIKTGAMTADWLTFMEAVEAKLKEKNHAK